MKGRDQYKKGEHDEAKRLYEEAEKQYRKTLQINPDDESALICLGITLERLNRDKKAEDCYKKVIEKNPKNVKVYTTYGYFLSDRGREEEAIRKFDEIIKIDPNNTKVRNQLIYLQSERPNIHAYRARALMKSGKFDEAEREIIDAIRLNPKNSLPHKNFGILKEELGDRAQSDGG